MDSGFIAVCIVTARKTLAAHGKEKLTIFDSRIIMCKENKRSDIPSIYKIEGMSDALGRGAEASAGLCMGKTGSRHRRHRRARLTSDP